MVYTQLLWIVACDFKASVFRRGCEVADYNFAFGVCDTAHVQHVLVQAVEVVENTIIGHSWAF